MLLLLWNHIIIVKLNWMETFLDASVNVDKLLEVLKMLNSIANFYKSNLSGIKLTLDR